MTERSGSGRPLHLTLFFTRGVSLQTWDAVGMFAREVALYQALATRGMRVAFVTYGDRGDYAYAGRIPGVRILPNWPGWSLERYERWLRWLHGWHLWRTDVIKTNQTDGALVALNAARRWRKPFVARCGYMWSINMGFQFGAESATQQHVREIERKVFSAADHVIVTTGEMAEDVTERIPGTLGKTSTVPNYVETERFMPPVDAVPDSRRPYDVVFVGRLEAEKNLPALLKAVGELRLRALIIGAGSLGEGLRRDFARDFPNAADRVTWWAQVSNVDLPGYYVQARIFALVSHYEGHPKTLIEAMACGLPVLGTDVRGIRSVITHGVNGWLCGTDSTSIRDGLRRLQADVDLRSELGRRARAHAEQHYSLEHVAGLELDIYRRLVAERRSLKAGR